MLILLPRSMFLRWICSLLTDEPLQLSLPDKGFNFLLQVIVVSGVMAVITVEAAVLFSRPFIRISLQLARKSQGPFILNLHQDLVDRGSQWGESCELPYKRLRASVLSPLSNPSHLLSPVRPYVFLSFPFLGLLFSGQ